MHPHKNGLSYPSSRPRFAPMEPRHRLMPLALPRTGTRQVAFWMLRHLLICAAFPHKDTHNIAILHSSSFDGPSQKFMCLWFHPAHLKGLEVGLRTALLGHRCGHHPRDSALPEFSLHSRPCTNLLLFYSDYQFVSNPDSNFVKSYALKHQSDFLKPTCRSRAPDAPQIGKRPCSASYST